MVNSEAAADLMSLASSNANVKSGSNSRSRRSSNARSFVAGGSRSRGNSVSKQPSASPYGLAPVTPLYTGAFSPLIYGKGAATNKQMSSPLSKAIDSTTGTGAAMTRPRAMTDDNKPNMYLANGWSSTPHQDARLTPGASPFQTPVLSATPSELPLPPKTRNEAALRQGHIRQSSASSLAFNRKAYLAHRASQYKTPGVPPLPPRYEDIAGDGRKPMPSGLANGKPFGIDSTTASASAPSNSTPLAEPAQRRPSLSESDYLPSMTNIGNTTYTAVLDVIDDYRDAWLGEDEEELEQLEEDRRAALCDLIVNERKYLLPLHEDLLKDLQWTAANHVQIGSMEDVALAFMKHIPNFRHYLTYLRDYPDALALLDQLQSQNSHFRRALETCSINAGHVNLRAYLGNPKDRIPRYHTFLLRMLELYTPQDPEYVGFVECLQHMQYVNEEVVRIMSLTQQREAVFQIQSSLIGFNDILVTASRRLVYHGNLNIVSQATSKMEQRCAFLFNDILLLTKEQENGTYEFKSRMELRGAEIHDLQDSAKTRNVFVVCTESMNECYLQAETPEARRRWLHYLREVTRDPLAVGPPVPYDSEASAMGRSLLNTSTAFGWNTSDDVEDSIEVSQLFDSADQSTHNASGWSWLSRSRNSSQFTPTQTGSPADPLSPNTPTMRMPMYPQNAQQRSEPCTPKAALHARMGAALRTKQDNRTFERRRAASNTAGVLADQGIYAPVAGTAIF
ncbi:hypothetical protein THASP1DRAFT_26569 [Thamnocephalis sphaerospora]|uniref:DH domain-containing protein n=1 Tax=Thamnocephalis sphaerospora TaxID=78915 RepID=A0A4P9XGS8_9FUNG|nr:hypothetical protein THASP1DRAFT_26569 [Thamnocephalis sphaerospora]|eukprot:RKP04854.1 hypothetical protein THASP1DRAFT_26569 [Thamnocephalis sphaerospora]